MEFINSWVNCILATIILIGLVEIIIPDGENKKFVLLVTGVVASFVIVSPVLKLISKDFSIEEVFDIDIIEDDFFYISTLNNMVERQSEVLEEVFSENIVSKFNNTYSDMKIKDCKIVFLHDEEGKIIEIKEVAVSCEYSVENIGLLKQRVAEVCEVEIEKVRVM